MQTKEISYQLMQKLPTPMSNQYIIQQMIAGTVDYTYMQAIKNISNLPDSTLSTLLDVTPKTLKTYIKGTSHFKESIQEQILLLLNLYKHGIHVFSGEVHFQQWLDRPNFYLDQKKPLEFLVSKSGISFIDDQLTAIQYGENA
ncbi:antitoxin Xre/MbcA/ParS toxin-binding domain-containing protein [Aquirufa sp. ROCK2-A2]